MSCLFFFLLSPYILAENEYIIEIRSFIKSSLSFSEALVTMIFLPFDSHNVLM